MNKNKVPRLFSTKGAKAQTVGELIKQLQKLPQSLHIKQDYPNLGCRVYVCNVSMDTIHVSIDAVDE